jgi:predicted N-acyltransferase
MEIHTSIEAVNQNQWNSAVEQSEYGSVFHRYEWLCAIEEGIRIEPRHLIIKKDGNIRALYPNFVMDLELPFELPDHRLKHATRELRSIQPGYGGPIIRGDEERLLNQLLGSLTRMEGSIIRHRMSTFDTGHIRYSKLLEETGYRPYLMTCRFEIDLTHGWEEIHSSMDSNKRRNLRKARENDVTITDDPLTEEVLQSFYRTYERSMKRVGGSPYPFAFFESLSRRLPGRIKLFTARIGDDSIGQLITVIDDEQDTVHSFFQAVDEEDFQYYPSEIMEEHAMKWSIDNGYSWYDFGKTTDKFTDGQFKDKEEIGGRALPVLSWERGLSPIRWNAFKLARHIYRRKVNK